MKTIDARLARVEGQIRGVRRMLLGQGRSDEAIALQLAATRRAMNRIFYEVVSHMIRTDPPSEAPALRERGRKIAQLLERSD